MSDALIERVQQALREADDTYQYEDDDTIFHHMARAAITAALPDREAFEAAMGDLVNTGIELANGTFMKDVRLHAAAHQEARDRLLALVYGEGV